MDVDGTKIILGLPEASLVSLFGSPSEVREEYPIVYDLETEVNLLHGGYSQHVKGRLLVWSAQDVRAAYLKDRLLWIEFSSRFRRAVNGVRIGDAQDKIVARWGAPSRRAGATTGGPQMVWEDGSGRVALMFSQDLTLSRIRYVNRELPNPRPNAKFKFVIEFAYLLVLLAAVAAVVAIRPL